MSGELAAGESELSASDVDITGEVGVRHFLVFLATQDSIAGSLGGMVNESTLLLVLHKGDDALN